MVLKSAKEIDLMRVASRVVAEVLQLMRQLADKGVSTRELDREAENYILKAGCKPAFKGYQGYPTTLCTSVNEQIVHGIPSKYRLKDGDLLSVDVGAIYEGYYGDGASTILIGSVSETHRKLAEVTEAALYKGIEKARVGGYLGDISHAIQEHVEKHGFSVVRDFVGHGIGTNLHEEPQVPNYGLPGHGPKLEKGLVIAIEPMVNEGTHQVRILKDGWTATTADGKYSAHYEHTVAITEEGPEILTRISEL